MAIDEVQWIKKLKTKDFTYQELLDNLPSLVKYMPNQFYLVCCAIIDIDVLMSSGIRWKALEAYRARELSKYSTASKTVILQCLEIACKILRVIEPVSPKKSDILDVPKQEKKVEKVVKKVTKKPTTTVKKKTTTTTKKKTTTTPKKKTTTTVKKKTTPKKKTTENKLQPSPINKRGRKSAK